MGQKGDYVMLEVKNLTFQVQENGVERSIVENISFDVADGEMLVITGPNGGGKSTLAKVLMGIEKASAGQIILDGEDISNYDINHRADAGIGYAFQQPPRFKGMTVMKLLSLSAGKELKREECCKLLSTVGLCANEYIEREVDAGGRNRPLEFFHADRTVRENPQRKEGKPGSHFTSGENHSDGRPDHGHRRR